MKKIYVTGISGTGKTALAYALKNKGIRALDIDNVSGLCYWVNKIDGKKVKYEAVLNSEFINSHNWVCDVEQLKTFLSTGDSSVVLGIATNQDKFFTLFDKVILLQCKPETFIKRILQRDDNAFGKEKSAQEYLLSVYENFEKNALKQGAMALSTEAPIEEVAQAVIRELH